MIVWMATTVLTVSLILNQYTDGCFAATLNPKLDNDSADSRNINPVFYIHYQNINILIFQNQI